MRLRRIPLLLLALSAFGQDVGSGPINAGVRAEFLRAFFRNGFNSLVALPPLGDVRKYGSTGLVQEFSDAAKTQNVKYALIKANAVDNGTEAETVFQVYPSMYDYLGTIGVSTSGYPTTHTSTCGASTFGTCTFQLFDKNYALFVYSPATVNGANFFVRDPFFTKWRTLGGIGALGSVANAEENLTSGAGTGATATVQRFALGAIYNMTAGTNNGRLITVRSPAYDTYIANGGPTGFLGFPTSDELTQAADRRRQTFEGGAIEWTLGATPELKLPVATVSVNVSATKDRFDLGETFTLTASTFAGNGSPLTGRAVTWVSSNSRVITVESSGLKVNAKAVGGGTAVITAVSEGQSSRALTFFVVAPCCQIGEGAPSSSIQQLFIDAASRNRLAVKIPSPSPVRRIGNGYVQELLPQDESSPLRFLIAKPDSLASAFVVSGAILVRYSALGGPAGALGFPVADPTARGRQLFEGGALAGDPAQSVAGPILTRWAAQNYEAGTAGLPTGPAQSALSFQATLASVQPFTGGVILAHLTGASINKAFLVNGTILAKYNSIGGAGGTLGLPVDDEYPTGGKRRQDFEGGLIEYAPGASADVQERDRTPRISATPGTVAAGSRVRIAAGGFPVGATLRISVGGQADFIVETQTGAYAWEAAVAANAASEVVTLRAADVNGKALAVGSYIVQSSAETLAKLAKIRGDLQTGLPGARLPQPIRISVKDENGNPLIGVPVKFTPSPGTQIEEATAATDEKGEAQAYMRLPLAELPALATAEAGRQVVTFSARAQASSLANFPKFSQGGTGGDTKLGNESSTIAQKGALLVASAAIVRHLQNQGTLASPNGPADPLALNRYLKDLCLFDAAGEKVCDGFTAPAEAPERNVNPWRLSAFAGGSLDIVSLTVAGGLDAVRDALGRGSPVLLALAISAGQAPMGSHFVVGIGVDSGGGVVILDPSPAFNRGALAEYTNGFAVGGATYKATLAAALEMAGRTSSALGFLVMTAGAGAQVGSAQGPCGFGVAWPDTAAGATAPTRAPGTTAFRYCDGTQATYQLDLTGTGQQRFVLTDLGNVAGRTEQAPSLPAAFLLSRPASNWTASPQTLAFSAANVLNGASFTTELAPGSLASVFGSGLAIAGRETAIEIDGTAAPVVAATPFQVNFQIPASVTVGTHTMRVRSPFGTQEQSIEILETAPAIFALPGGRAAAVNQNGTINSSTAAAKRGEVVVLYVTGLGATDRRGNFDVVRTPVQVKVEGRDLQIQFAGAAPGYPGLYQVNARIPAEVAPGLDLRVWIEQGGRVSNRLGVSVQ
ncbi:MAG: hypothetical protein U0Q16_16075 [Bryobacteraceae bacterium]